MWPWPSNIRDPKSPFKENRPVAHVRIGKEVVSN